MDFRSRYKYNPKTDFIARGGFARVFKAEDVLLERQVALKVYSVETSGKYDLISEIRKVVQLEHPNLCRYYDVALLQNTTAMGEEEELQVGVMEYLDGGDIKSYVKQHPQHLHKLLVDVLQGLSYLHHHQIIHRDLKPANILIKNTPAGPVAKVTDFGISKSVGSSSTKSSELLGTIEYMSPEQFSPGKYGIGGIISYNLDLWSFGCLTYELIMGESFFGSRAAMGTEQVMMNILEEVDNSKINMLPQPFKAVVEQCLVKSARERVQHALQLIDIIKGKVSVSLAGSTEKEVNRIISSEKQVVADEATKVIEKERVPLPKPGAVAAEQKGAIDAILNKISESGYESLSPKEKRKLFSAKPTAVKTAVTSPAQKSAAPQQVHPVGEVKEKKRSSSKHFYKVGGVAAAVMVLLWVLNFNKPIPDPLPVPVEDTLSTSFKIPLDSSEIVVAGNSINTEDLQLEEEKKGLAAQLFSQEKPKQETPASEEVEEKQVKKYKQTGYFYEGLAAVELNGKWGFIDKEGQEVIPFKFSNYSMFTEGLAGVNLNGKCGFINKEGQEVIPFEFNDVLPFTEGLAAVELDGKWGYINKKGQEVIPFKFYDAQPFFGGLAAVELNGKWGYINKKGQEVIPFKFYDASFFRDGKAEVQIEPNGRWIYIDKSGKGAY